jgi:hypothetical protein
MQQAIKPLKLPEVLAIIKSPCFRALEAVHSSPCPASISIDERFKVRIVPKVHSLSPQQAQADFTSNNGGEHA